MSSFSKILISLCHTCELSHKQKQTHAFTCFFGTSILLYVLSSTIFILVQLSAIYSIFIEPISETTYTIHF